MLTLYSYPDLCGVADNNPFGLKVYAFMRLCRMQFLQKHILDTGHAPYGQLPYLTDNDRSIGDSDAIIAYLKTRYSLSIDDTMSEEQEILDHLLRRTLDDLYWSMSYSRWKDGRYWPQFRRIVLNAHADITESDMDAAHDYNEQRYYYQGIGRYDPDKVYERGAANLKAISNLLGERVFMFGPNPQSIDAAIYGFTANIYFYDILTPLKELLLSRSNLVDHCQAIHALVQE
ncbi:glutathione S-transferase family protein [Dyella monticola]|uniref:Glutathione S-transferase family protein n=1 Tax=Dyella monticola TaxID=1927958 RepID=A0A370X569_9GAMM|nr:glutathione S-transferase C-terminal domain-containing protein [Dyella monticola]RDS83564.1 glutathione S-transferase family protein [Dyella monticola]